jgi:hypothetical protein
VLILGCEFSEIPDGDVLAGALNSVKTRASAAREFSFTAMANAPARADGVFDAFAALGAERPAE